MIVYKIDAFCFEKYECTAIDILAILLALKD